MGCEGLNLTSTGERLLEELVRHGRSGVDRYALAEVVPCDPVTAGKVLRQLRDAGVIECDRRLTENGKDLRTIYRPTAEATVSPVLAA